MPGTILEVPMLLNIIIGLVVVETGCLLFYRRVSGRGMPSREVISFLGAGLCLLIALRAIAAEPSFALFAIAMLASLILHISHIAQRWRA